MVYIRRPFAESGTRVEVPTDDPGNGAVSFETGYGPQYQQNPSSDPTARRVEREFFNGLQFRLSAEIQRYQQFGVPEFITAQENDGVSFPYSIGAMVRFDPGDGARIYRSLVNSNTALPTVETNWLDTSTYLTEADLDNLVPVSREISTGDGLDGGGDLSQDRTFTLDLNSLTVSPPDLADEIGFADASITDNPSRKATIQDILGIDQPGKVFTSAVTIEGIMIANQVRDLGGTSDERLKTEKRRLDPKESLAAVLRWRKAVACYNAHAKQLIDCENKDQVCFYAQDLEETHPELVDTLPIPGDKENTEYLMINYQRPVVVLASAIEEIDDKLNRVNETLDQFQDRLNDLENFLGIK